MNRKPGETAEQWHARTEAEYQRALEALESESRRLGLDGWSAPGGTYPPLDEEYDRAMDDLDVADDERTDAMISLQREGPPTHLG